MADVKYFTKEGLQKLKDELHHLKTKERADISKQIQEAREKGDLSENAEYDAAKEAQSMLERRIAQLEETLSKARLLDTSKVDTTKVLALSTVKAKNHNTGKEVEYTLVPEEEANIKKGKISVKSPIGKGLLGKREGDVAEIDVPAGKLKLEILEIQNN